MALRTSGWNTKKAVSNGIGYVASDRLSAGIMGDLSERVNCSIAAQNVFANRGILNTIKETNDTRAYIKKLNIKTPSINTLIATLSGGNQQKVLLGRWLYKKSKLLLLDQPTRGVDVGAKREIYQMIRDLTREGMAIILISDERSELIGLANRILVFSEGTLTKEFQCDAEAKPDENDIIRYM